MKRYCFGQQTLCKNRPEVSSGEIRWGDFNTAVTVVFQLFPSVVFYQLSVTVEDVEIVLNPIQRWKQYQSHYKSKTP